MCGPSEFSELYLYVGQGYFQTFTNRLQKYVGDKVHYAFSSDFTLDPTVKSSNPTNPKTMLGPKVDDEENPLYQW